MSRHCQKCGTDLEKTGLTTTRHDILTCPVCNQSYVAWYDQLELIHDNGFLGVPGKGECHEFG